MFEFKLSKIPFSLKEELSEFELLGAQELSFDISKFKLTILSGAHGENLPFRFFLQSLC